MQYGRNCDSHKEHELVIEDNTIYEMDMDCLRCKEQQEKREWEEKQKNGNQWK